MTQITQTRYHRPGCTCTFTFNRGDRTIKHFKGIIGLLLLLGCAAFSSQSNALQAGTAKRTLELPADTPLAGYVKRLGRSAAATHDPISVRALYLEDGETGIVLVSADLHSITPELRERVLTLAPADIVENHIILTATHTHSGPGGLSESWFAKRYIGRYMEETLDLVAQNIADAIAESMQTKKRATIGYDTTSQDALTKNTFSGDGLRDPQVGVVRVDDSDGNPIAILGTLSAHPTTAPESDILSLSADFPGYFCAHLESLSHEDTVAFFLNGASGDQSCANREKKSGWEWPQYIGTELAILVKSVANKIDCSELPVSINYTNKTTPLSLADPFLSDEVLFQTLEIGPLLISFLPGEPYAAVQSELNRIAKQNGYSAHITVGLANDYLMDITTPLPPRARNSAPGLDVLGPDAGNWAVDAIRSLMRRGEYAPPTQRRTQGVPLTEIQGGYTVTLTGNLESRLRQFGATTNLLLHETWTSNVLPALQNGEIDFNLPLWEDKNRINATPIALPILADQYRSLLRPFSIENTRLFAQGAEEPFDKVHLISHFQGILSGPYLQKGGANFLDEGGQLVSYIAAAPPGTPIIVQRVQPDQGNLYLSVTLPWDTLLRVGINDAGLGLAALNALPSIDYTDILKTKTNLEQAVNSITQKEPAENERVYLIDRPTGDQNLLEYKDDWKVTNSFEKSKTPSPRPAGLTTLSMTMSGTAEFAREHLTKLDDGTYPVVFAVILQPTTRSLYLAVSQGPTFPETFQHFSLQAQSP